MSKELIRSIVTGVTLFAGVILFFYGSLISNFFRGFVGDILVVVFLFFLLSLFIKTRRDQLLIAVFAFAVTTELLQLLVPAGFGGRVGELVVGSTFDPIDFIAYGIGVGIAYSLNTFVDKLRAE